MPPRGISSFADSDMEDVSQFHDENTAISIENIEVAEEPLKKKGGRTKGTTNRVTKPKTTAGKKDTDGTTKRAKKVPVAKRKALEEQVNEQNRGSKDDRVISAAAKTKAHNDTAMSDVAVSEDELESPRTLAQDKKAAAAKQKRKAPAKSARPKADPQRRAKKEETSTGTNGEQFSTTIAETQRDDDRLDLLQPATTQSFFKSSIGPGNRFERTVRNEPSFRHRAGSASDSERNGGDPQLRRKLGDMTRKFESIELKYRNLRETGIIEANTNVEKLRKQCEATSAASNELVASLKKELATQASMTSEYCQIQTLVQTRDSENARLLSKVSELTASLTSAQNEVKTLQAKLAASRTAATTVESANSKGPGSAMKTNVPTRTVMVGSAEAAQAAQTAQLKEDLYSDLTGLIIRGVKRTEEEDMFDCIQTGRNGTLHFKLGVAHDDNGKPTSFEDTEFLYTPMLDVNRDRDLLELLPDYLTEDITFSRQHAAKFYSRVVETLTKKRVDE